MINITSLIHQKIFRLPQDILVVSLVSEPPPPTEDERRRTGSYDPVELARGIFPMASETIVLPADSIQAMNRVQNLLIENTKIGALCLLGNWEVVRHGPLRQHPLATNAKGLLSVADLILYETLETLPENTKVLALFPRNILVDNSRQIVRDYLWENHTIHWIIEHRSDPGSFLGVHPSFSTCSLLLETGRQAVSPIRLFQVPTYKEEDNGESLLSEIDQLQRQQGGRTTNGYILREQLPMHSRWGVARNNPRWAEQITDLSVLGSATTLQEVADILLSENRSKRLQRQEIPEAQLFTSRYLRPSGQIEFNTEEQHPINSNVYEGYIKLLPGDMVIRRINNFQKRHATTTISLLIAQITLEHGESLYADDTVWIIRTNLPQTDAYQEILFDYLSSERVVEWFQAHDAEIHINRNELLSLPVPEPDKDNLAIWEQSSKLLAEIKTWQDALKTARRQLFKQQTIDSGREQLVSTVLDLSQRVLAAQKTDTFSWRVRNLYPHPLAYRWRYIETMSDSFEKYREALKTAEFLIAYLAIMGIVLFENQLGGKLPGQIKVVSDRLQERPQNGMNFGDWAAILKETSSKKLRTLGPSTPFFELTSYLNDDAVQDKLDLLKTWRDDYAHFRDDELQERLREVEANLALLFNRAEFLTNYPLYFITDTQFRDRKQNTLYSYQKLAGDHWLIETEKGEYEVPLEKNALYFATPQGKLYLASPWLIRARCPTCGTMETYCFDHISKATGEIVIKSLEQGHSLTADYLREAFFEVGLLNNEI